jgi:hypothetical protein
MSIVGTACESCFAGEEFEFLAVRGLLIRESLLVAIDGLGYEGTPMGRLGEFTVRVIGARESASRRR